MHGFPRFRRLAALLGTAAILGLLTACGGGDDDDEGDDSVVVAPVTPGAGLSSGARGKLYWIGYCQSCHGNDYSLGRSVGATLSEIASNRGGMGRLRNLVKDAEAADIRAYTINPSAY